MNDPDKPTLPSPKSPYFSGPPSSGSLRIPGIDALRAVAILLVMTAHAGLGKLVPGGFGVTIFFFLSGYLITTLLRLEQQRTGSIGLRAFYIRRALRILPPLYATLALTVVLVAVGAIDVAMTGRSLALDVLFLTNYAGVLGIQPAMPIPLWSLDVEEHFYLFFPLLFVVMAAAGTRRPPLILGALCMVVLIVRLATFAVAGPSEIYYWSHTRIDSILFGTILATWQNPFLEERAWRPTKVPVGIALGVILLTFVVRDPWFRETIRYSLQGMALFVLFSAAIQARGPMVRVLDNRVLRTVALLSYTLYLVHMPMLAMTERLWPTPLAVISAYLLSFAWAGLIYVAIERPIAGLRKRSLQRAMLLRAA